MHAGHSGEDSRQISIIETVAGNSGGRRPVAQKVWFQNRFSATDAVQEVVEAVRRAKDYNQYWRSFVLLVTLDVKTHKIQRGGVICPGHLYTLIKSRCAS